MSSANERRRYSVTSSLIGWAHTQNDPSVHYSVYGLSQWEKTLKCNVFSHWLSPSIHRIIPLSNILCMGSANERRRYSVTSSLIGWAHTQNDPSVQYSVYGLSQWKKTLHCNVFSHWLSPYTVSYWQPSVHLVVRPLSWQPLSVTDMTQSRCSY